jgi:hypothetical protein
MKRVLPLICLLAFTFTTVSAQLPQSPVAATDSNVGISNPAPLYRLDVQTAVDNDGIRLRGLNPGNLRIRLNNTVANKEYSFLVGGTSSAFGNGNFVISDISRLDSARFLINGNTGYVAIGGGTTNPAEMLTVNGMVQAAGLRLTQNAGTNRILASDGSGTATWQPANALNLISGSGSFNYITKWTPNGFTLGNSQLVDDGTYVGVGNVTPQYRLDLATAQDNDGMRLRSTNTGNLRLRFNNAGTNKEYSFLLGGTGSSFGNGNLAITDMSNGDSARLLINSTTGNIGIGSNNTNPAEKLTVKGTVLADGLKIPTNAGANKVLTSDANGVASWQPASAGTITGGGTVNYVPLWTPNGTALGNSQLLDNGSNIGIATPTPQYKLDVNTTANNDGVRISGSTTGNVNLRLSNTNAAKEYSISVGGSTSAYGNGNFAITNLSRPDTAALTIHGTTGNVVIGNILANPAEKLTVAGNVEASGVKLFAGGPGVNKVLVSDANGLGSWQNAGAANLVSGSGTLNYIPKWTPNGFTMSNSQLVDNGTYVGVGNVAPLRKLDVNSNTNYTGINITSPQIPSLNLTATNAGTAGKELISFGEPVATPGGTVNAQIGYYRTGESINPGNLIFSTDNAGTRPDISISKTNAGNVGIGLANATQKLDVNGTVRATGLLIPTNAGTGKVLTSDASGNATWQTPVPGGGNNVIYSNWIISPYAARDSTIDVTCVKVRQIDAPSLSTAAINSGVVMVYMKVGTGLGPYNLPYITEAGGATNQITCIYNLQKILLARHTFKSCRFSSSVAESYPGEPLMVNFGSAIEYRYVIILGTQSGGRMSLGPNEHYANSISDIPDMAPAQAIPGKVYSTVKD